MGASPRAAAPSRRARSDTHGGTPEYEAARVADAAARHTEREAFRALLATRRDGRFSPGSRAIAQGAKHLRRVFV
jgi:hypothetical protein